jgi:hypothetical protein
MASYMVNMRIDYGLLPPFRVPHVTDVTNPIKGGVTNRLQTLCAMQTNNECHKIQEYLQSCSEGDVERILKICLSRKRKACWITQEESRCMTSVRLVDFDADVVGHILSFLSFQDIVKFGGVCKHTASIVDSLPHDLNLRKQKEEFPVVSSVFPHLFALDATTTQRSDYKVLERLMDVPSVVPRTTSDPKTTGEWTFVIFDGFEDRPLLIQRSTPEFSNVKDSIDSDGWMMVEGSASLDADVRDLLWASNTPRMVILVGTRCVFDGASMYEGGEDYLQFSGLSSRAGVFSDDEWVQLSLFHNRIDLTFKYHVVNAKFVTTFASKIAKNTHGSRLQMDGYEILEEHETFRSKMNRVTVCERVYQLCRDNCGFVRECLVAEFWHDSRAMCLYDGPPTLEVPIKEVLNHGIVHVHRPGHAMKFPPVLDKFLRAKSLSMYGVDHV